MKERLALLLPIYLYTSCIIADYQLLANLTLNVMALCVSSVEAEFKDQVSPPFVSGVQKLEDFLEVLQGEAVHSLSTTAKVDKVASKLRPYVTQAYVKFSAAHKKADEINARICREIEEGVAQQHQIECDIRKKEEEESSLSNRYV